MLNTQALRYVYIKVHHSIGKRKFLAQNRKEKIPSSKLKLSAQFQF